MVLQKVQPKHAREIVQRRREACIWTSAISIAKRAGKCRLLFPGSCVLWCSVNNVYREGAWYISGLLSPAYVRAVHTCIRYTCSRVPGNVYGIHVCSACTDGLANVPPASELLLLQLNSCLLHIAGLFVLTTQPAS